MLAAIALQAVAKMEELSLTENPAIGRDAGGAADYRLITQQEVCTLFGGASKPIHPSTLRRGMVDGRFPAPVKVGLKNNRWLLSECEALMRRLVEARHR